MGRILSLLSGSGIVFLAYWVASAQQHIPTEGKVITVAATATASGDIPALLGMFGGTVWGLNTCLFFGVGIAAFWLGRVRRNGVLHSALAGRQSAANGYRNAHTEVPEIHNARSGEVFAAHAQLASPRSIERMLHHRAEELETDAVFALSLQMSLRKSHKVGIVAVSVKDCLGVDHNSLRLIKEAMPNHFITLGLDGSDLIVLVPNIVTRDELKLSASIVGDIVAETLTGGRITRLTPCGAAMYPIDGYSLGELRRCAIDRIPSLLPDPPYVDSGTAHASGKCQGMSINLAA